MSGQRRLFLDRSPGERRGVVTLNGAPERLLIERGSGSASQRPGARLVARVARIERGLATAFLEMPEGPEAVLQLSGQAAKVVEGAAVEIEIAAEAREGKGAVARLVGPAEGAPRLLTAAPSLVERLAAFAPDESVIEGVEAREAADLAQEAALAVEHPLPGGGGLSIEPTRALTAIDVDIGARSGSDARRVARQANLLAIGEAARLLRLKGIGGLVVVDLAGKGHDGAAMSAAAKAAFAPDGAQVSIGPISRFGLFELALPRHHTPIAEVLCGSNVEPTPLTRALSMLRDLEREGRANPGSRLEARCSKAVARAAAPYERELAERLGPRFVIHAHDGPDALLEIVAL